MGRPDLYPQYCFGIVFLSGVFLRIPAIKKLPSFSLLSFSFFSFFAFALAFQVSFPLALAAFHALIKFWSWTYSGSCSWFMCCLKVQVILLHVISFKTIIYSLFTLCSKIPKGVQPRQLLVLRGRGMLIDHDLFHSSYIIYFMGRGVLIDYNKHVFFTWFSIDSFHVTLKNHGMSLSGLPKQIGLVDHGDQYVRFRINFPSWVLLKQPPLHFGPWDIFCA